jgi:ABC-2 type transport system permease protein
MRAPASNPSPAPPAGPSPKGLQPTPAPGAPIIHGVNWQGLKTLYLKEVQRFFKVQLQTIWAPAITTLLFLAIFLVAIGGFKREVLGVPFAAFLAPGLIMMGMAQNSFANTLSSLIIAKVQGTIVDVLTPPLSTSEILTALVAGAVTRAWLVGLAIWAAMLAWPGVPVGIAKPGLVLLFGTLGAAMLALMGVLTGIWAEKFDHGAAVTNFIVQPLTLLSGTFYAIDRLPPALQTLSMANPFFYMIDGFRAGFIAVSEASPLAGALALAVLCLLLWAAAHALFESGWKLRP